MEYRVEKNPVPANPVFQLSVIPAGGKVPEFNITYIGIHPIRVKNELQVLSCV
jgi:hypothetical protein